MPKRAIRVNAGSCSPGGLNKSFVTSRQAESPEDRSVRVSAAALCKRKSTSDYERSKVFQRYHDRNEIADKRRGRKGNKLLQPISREDAMKELAYRSKSGFTRDYKKWCIDGHGTTATQVGRKPLLQPYYYTKAKADAEHITKDVGGMPFMKFMEFISPYVRDSKKSDGSAAHFPDQYPVSSLANKATFEAYYREILPCKVRNGDRALQQRLNVRNDMLAWTSQHVMSIVALQGHDGTFFPAPSYSWAL